MGIFDMYVEESTPAMSNEEVLAEALNVMSEAYLDSEEEIDYMFEHYVVQSLEEGANTDMIKAYMAFAKEYKAAWKDAKKSVKAKNYDEALSKLNGIKKIISEAESKIRSIDANSVTSLICGTLAAFGIQMTVGTLGGAYGLAVGSAFNTAQFGAAIAKSAAKDTAKAIPGIALAATGISSLTTLIKSFKELKSGKTENPKEAFNQTRQLLLQAFKECNKAVADWEKAINKAKAKQEKKESK